MSDPQLIPGLQTLHYVHQPTHRLLAADAWRSEGPNIGQSGAHLTISFMCRNRSALSLRLLESIGQWLPDFRGELLIIDNGSNPAEIERVRNAATALPLRTRLVELGHNFGVAGGRNRTMEHVETDWIMCLDNDMVFVANPFWAIQNDLAQLGCHFLNLPLLDTDRQTLFALGGHLYPGIAGDQVNIGAGSAYAQAPVPIGGYAPPFLSTFLFGGASVLNVPTFRTLGGYDENMFVGFEDIDFSIRLFQAGLKVGNTRCVAVVHDHPPPASTEDQDYERARFSRDTIRHSAEYLEQKHGMRVWTEGLENWLIARERDLGLQTEPSPTIPTPASVSPASTPEDDPRPRIALITDTDNWAFANISRQLERHLGDHYRFDLIPTIAVDNVVQVFLLARDADLIHVFWREYLPLLRQPHVADYLRYLGDHPDRFLAAELRGRSILSTCIYDHLHLTPEALAERRWVYRDLVDGYYVGSERLRRIYADLPDWPAPAAVLPDGVDPRLFYPQDTDRFENIASRKIVIGWTGNSNWAAEFEDFKGVRTILKPAVQQLIAEGLPFELRLADRAAGGPQIPHDRMVDYYAGIDLYVCTSKIEGTPNPVLECLACGVPIVSTDVGIVPEAFGPLQREFILAERSIPCLQSALRRLAARPDLFPRLSRENLAHAPNWHWSRQTRGFKTYFDNLLALRPTRTSAPPARHA